MNSNQRNYPKKSDTRKRKLELLLKIKNKAMKLRKKKKNLLKQMVNKIK